MKTSKYPDLLWFNRNDFELTSCLKIDFSKPLDDENLKKIESVVVLFCKTGGLGGFCKQSAATGSCICRIISFGYLKNTVHVELDCQNVDHRAFQVLRNMCARLYQEDLQPCTLTVLIPGTCLPENSVAPEIDEDNEEQAYPPLHEKSCLEYSGEDESIDSWFRRCVVSVGVSVEQLHVDAMRSLANVWFDVLETGGYAMPLDFPWEVECVGDTVSQFEEDSIEITVLRFQASEEAWVALSNLIYMNSTKLNISFNHFVVD